MVSNKKCLCKWIALMDVLVPSMLGLDRVHCAKKIYTKKKNTKKYSPHLSIYITFHHCVIFIVFYFAAQCSAVILFCWIQCSSPWLVLVHTVLLSLCLLMWYEYWFYPRKQSSRLIK